jgi:sugar phosphate isomerase/epimerase
LKPWQLNRKVDGLSNIIDDSTMTETKIDISSFSEPERILLDKVQEITNKYASGLPPKDIIEKNADLWYKGLEIFGRRATELFVYIMPASICSDELEEWYFKIYFHNFMLDWLERVEQVREMPKEKRDELIGERREMGMLNIVFRLKRYPPPTTQKQSSNKEPES